MNQAKNKMQNKFCNFCVFGYDTTKTNPVGNADLHFSLKKLPLGNNDKRTNNIFTMKFTTHYIVFYMLLTLK